MFNFNSLRNLSSLFKKKRKEPHCDSEAKYRDIVEHSLVGVYIIQDDTLKYVNRKFCEIFGYSYEEIVNKMSPTSLALKEDKDIVKENVRKRISKESKSMEYEFRGVKKDGSIVWIGVLGNLTPYKGKPAISGTIIDITDRKLLEDALHIREERLRVTLEVTEIGIWDWDVKNDIWFASPIYYTMLGYDPVDGPSDRTVWLNRIHPDDRKYVRAKINDVLTYKEDSYVYEARMLHANGSHRWHQVIGHIVEKDDQGDIKRMVGIRKDITDFKQTEEELKISKNRLRVLIDTLPDLVWVKNPQGVYLQCNQRFEQLFGAAEKEIVGKTDYNFVNKELADFFRQKDNEAAVAGKPSINEEEVTFANGHMEILETIKTPMYESDGTFIGVLGIGRDITQRKKAEFELLKAKEKAEESDRLKSAFLANMSHEIRTPMNGILGFAGLLKKPELSGKQHNKYIQIIEKSGVRMLNIINDIISISKIESGITDIRLSEININNQLQFVYDSFKLDANHKKLKLSFTCELPENRAIITTDAEKFYRILSNLAKNAIKYTDEGTIEFGYTVKGEKMEFYVKDTGIGIPKEKAKVIFDRFVQANITDKTAQQGVGLGLAISKAYVEMLGGEIWVVSEESKGSTFFFTLPSNIK